MSEIRGKSLKSVSKDIAEGYTVVNPIFLKPLDVDALKGLYHEIMKIGAEIRGEKFPHNDVAAIRHRNMRLQRLHTAAMIIKSFARDKRIPLI
jgi:hypothetical protein